MAKPAGESISHSMLCDDDELNEGGLENFDDSSEEYYEEI